MAVYFKILSVALLALLAATTTWRIQDWRYGKQISDIRAQEAQTYAAKLAEERATEQERYETAMEALNAARRRENQNRAAAAAARAESDRLRDDLAAATAQLPGLAGDALRDRAATLGELLGLCAAEYQGMAGKAQRHADDVRTLTEAWPKR